MSRRGGWASLALLMLLAAAGPGHAEPAKGRSIIGDAMRGLDVANQPGTSCGAGASSGKAAVGGANKAKGSQPGVSEPGLGAKTSPCRDEPPGLDAFRNKKLDEVDRRRAERSPNGHGFKYGRPDDENNMLPSRESVHTGSPNTAGVRR